MDVFAMIEIFVFHFQTFFLLISSFVKTKFIVINSLNIFAINTFEVCVFFLVWKANMKKCFLFQK